MKRNVFFRVFFWILGLVILAVGIMLNSKTDLGVTPIISVSYCVSSLVSDRIPLLTFSNATFILYSLFVVAEVIIHSCRKEFRVIPADLLQLVVSLVFTRFMSLFDNLIPDLRDDLAGTFFGTMAGRIIALPVAIILTGIGAAMSLNARIVPNPGDGIVQALADCSGKSTGFCKNFVDISCVVVSAVLSLIFTGKLIGLGIGAGTAIAMIGVGRTVAVYNRLCKAKTDKLSGIER